ncbi:hypothetical protein PAEPH01_2593, partial [Pancytospora epiphaga]
MLGIDLLEIKETYVLVAIDYYTRYGWATVVPMKQGKEIVKTLEHLIIRRVENPETIVADQGLEFNNQWIEEMCRRRNMKLHLIGTDHHQSNGRVERLNRTIREYI